MYPPQLQRFLVGLLVIVGLTGSLLTIAPTSVSATTGPTIALPPSRYKVALRVADLYVGSYELKSVAPAARISTCALGIEVSNQGFLLGLAQFYGYTLAGYQDLWINVLYNFHLTAKGVMAFDLLGAGGSLVEGRVFVTRSKHGDLSGKIALPLGTYAISFHKVSNQWSPSQG